MQWSTFNLHTSITLDLQDMHLGALKTRKKKEYAAHLPRKALFLYCIVVYSFISWREKDKICICSLVAPRMKKGGCMMHQLLLVGTLCNVACLPACLFIDHLQFPPPQAQATSHNWWWEKKKAMKRMHQPPFSWSWSPQDWWLLCRLLLLLYY